jgi:pimeloyl-ACP methyl ester carboxylesterase
MTDPITLRWQEEPVPAGGVTLHVRRVVTPPAPPLLLLHGLGVAGSVWVPFARRLAPRYAAVAPDLRGHGASDHPPQGYAPSDYARDLAALAATLHLAAMPVLGHSLGALVALALADLRPDLVSALVLVDPPLDAAVSYRTVQDVYRLRHEPPGALESYLQSTDPTSSPLLAAALARLFRQADDAAFQAVLHTPPDHWDAWDRAPHVQQPTLLVQADPDHGGILGPIAAHSFTGRLPRGQMCAIPGAAHAVHASHPAPLAAAVLDFLAATAPSA